MAWRKKPKTFTHAMLRYIALFYLLMYTMLISSLFFTPLNQRDHLPRMSVYMRACVCMFIENKNDSVYNIPCPTDIFYFGFDFSLSYFIFILLAAKSVSKHACTNTHTCAICTKETRNKFSINFKIICWFPNFKVDI